MTEEHSLTQAPDFLAAKISIYERVLRGLLKDAPQSKEIEADVRDLVAHWRKNFRNSPMLAKAGEETLTALFQE